MVRHMNSMQLFGDVRQANLAGPTVLTIGNFDGVHLGHQALFRTMLELASSQSAAAPHIGILTFDPHPLAVLRPELAPTLLTSPQERIELMANLGLNLGIIQPFTQEIANLRAVEFMTLLKQHVGLTTLVVGPDFALGRGRSGDIPRLREIGSELGYQVVVIEPVHWGEHSVRSSNIRKLLLDGHVAQAAELLGRFYAVSGEVVDGDRRGRLIGTPTANLLVPSNRLLPLDGVYATRTHIRQSDQDAASSAVYESVTNLGVRPTVDGHQHRFETHLLDFPPAGGSGDLYGQTLRVEFVARLRGEQRFPDLDALKNQIAADIEQARQIFSSMQTMHVSVGAEDRQL